MLSSLISTSRVLNFLGDFVSINIFKFFWIITLNRFDFISRSDFKFFWLYHPTSLDVKLNYLHLCLDKYFKQDVLVDRCILHKVMEPVTENLLLIMNKQDISCFAKRCFSHLCNINSIYTGNNLKIILGYILYLHVDVYEILIQA